MEEIFVRVLRELKPQFETPVVTVEFCRFANANNFIKLVGGAIQVRISDVFSGAAVFTKHWL
ncbi:MAG: hypothetical protein WKF37_04060 [Bryobacteraceae bacterium]